MELTDLIREFWWYWDLFDLEVRAFWQQYRPIIDFWLNEVLLVVLAYVLLLKGLNIGRETALGRWLGNNNLAFALVYGSFAVAFWVALFATDPWRYFARLLILLTALKVLLVLKDAYSGWWQLHRRAWLSAGLIAAELLVWFRHGWKRLLLRIVVVGLVTWFALLFLVWRL